MSKAISEICEAGYSHRLFMLAFFITRSATASGSISNFNPRGRLFRKRKRNFSVARKQRRALAQRALSSDFRQIRIVSALREMRQHDVPRPSIKTVRKPFRYVLV